MDLNNRKIKNHSPTLREQIEYLFWNRENMLTNFDNLHDYSAYK